MLQDAVDAFLDGLANERALDEPLMAALRARGFSKVNLTHGGAEFGKDIVAQKDRLQYAFQSKLGDIGQGDWRQMTGQLDELRLSDYVGPEFDLELPRRPVLVISGRFKGNAALAAAEYNRRARQRGEPGLEIWRRDELISLLAGSPDAVLRGSIDGALLKMLGSIERGEVDMDYIEAFSRRWEAVSGRELIGLSVIEATLLCEKLRLAHRLDLACHLALNLIRSAWANPDAVGQAPSAADAGARLFDVYAEVLWSESDDRLLTKRGLVGFSGPSAWITYPIRCMRLSEILGLYGLRLRKAGADRQATEVAAWLARFSAVHPGAAHLVSDRYAVSLIPPVLLLRRRHRAAAAGVLKRATVWLCDRYERGEFGLAQTGLSPRQEVDRLLGERFEHVQVRGRRSTSLAAAVLLDLAAVCRFSKMYEDIRNDQQAVHLVPLVLRTPNSVDQYSISGDSNRWELNPCYPDRLPRGRPLNLPHHAEPERTLVRQGRPWDLLAVSSALRDRHFIGPMAAALVDEH